jgi:hypothetical protein
MQHATDLLIDQAVTEYEPNAALLRNYGFGRTGTGATLRKTEDPAKSIYIKY